jgi:hypothetical protein
MATKKTTTKAAPKRAVKVVKKTSAQQTAAKKAPAKKPAVTKQETPVAKLKTYSAVVGRILRKPAVLAVLLVVIAGIVLATVDRQTNNQPKGGDAYQRELQAQVENNDGTPVTGRDPASQGQNSLEVAASSPAGAGQRTDAPAAGAAGHAGHANPADANNNAQGSGIGSNGCFTDYGIQGQECLPAHAAGDDKVLNCAEVHKHFPNGIKVVGTDRFHLDHDGDKVACGPSEAAH